MFEGGVDQKRAFGGLFAGFRAVTGAVGGDVDVVDHAGAIGERPEDGIDVAGVDVVRDYDDDLVILSNFKGETYRAQRRFRVAGSYDHAPTLRGAAPSDLVRDVLFRHAGKPMARKEDLRLLTGRGRFTDDFNLPGQAYAAVVRSPYAHARILGEHTAVFPNGAAIYEMEVDPETGEIAITHYSTVDDVGRCINPLIVHAQTHGGIAQGVGKAMWEACIVDPVSGQPLAGSFMDYGMPRFDNLPSFDCEIAEMLSPTNPLGIKAGSEGGTTPRSLSLG